MPANTPNVPTVNLSSSKSGSLPKLLMIGSSGHAAVLIDAVQLGEAYRIVGYLDDTVERGTIRRGYPVLGALSDIERVCSENHIENVALGVGDNWSRRRILENLLRQSPQLKFPKILHPSAVIAESAALGRGTVVLAACHVGPGSTVAEFCILNTGSSLDHDCQMLDFSSMGPGSFTGGLVKIGEYSAIGVGVSISDRVSIGRHVVVGTGAVVVRDISDLVVAFGNPARAHRSRLEGEAYVDTNKKSS